MRNSIIIISLIFVFQLLHAQKKLQFEHGGNSYQVKMPNKLPKLPDEAYHLPQVLTAYNDTRTKLMKYFDEFLIKKSMLSLSDFQYLKILYAVSEKYLPNENEQSLFMAAMMELSGFEVEVAYTRSKIFAFSKLEQDVFELPFVQLENENFVNVMLLLNKNYSDSENWYYNTNIYKKMTGKGIKFETDRHYFQMEDKVVRTFDFTHKGQFISLQIPVDKKVVDEWNSFPHLSEGTYIKERMSPETVEAFKEQLGPLLTQRPQKEQLELLLDFVRNAFNYQEDEVHYGRSRPFTAEETLYYNVSDCEDRCALFYQLVDELVGLPMLAIGMPSHMTVAIQLDTDELFEKEIEFNKKRYIVCDPTGPENSHEIGILNMPFNGADMEIIAESKGFVSPN